MRFKRLKAIQKRRCDGCGKFKPNNRFTLESDSHRPSVCIECDAERRIFRPHADLEWEKIDRASSCNCTKDQRGGYPGSE